MLKFDFFFLVETSLSLFMSYIINYYFFIYNEHYNYIFFISHKPILIIYKN